MGIKPSNNLILTADVSEQAFVDNGSSVTGDERRKLVLKLKEIKPRTSKNVPIHGSTVR